MKKFNFEDFNSDSKNFTITVIFFSRKKQKRLQKVQIITFIVYQGVQGVSAIFRQFPIISKISEHYRRCPKIARPSPFEHRLKVMSDFIVDFYQEQIRIDQPKTMGFR